MPNDHADPIALRMATGGGLTRYIAPTQSPDLQAIAFWLAVYQSRSPHTYRTYAKEASRWLAFLELNKGPNHPSLLQIAGEDDIHAYLLSLGRPAHLREAQHDPFEPLILPQHLIRKYAINGQPFATEHQPRSIAHATACLSALYKFLSGQIDSQTPAYVTHNPTLRLSRMLGRRVEKASRHFTREIYRELIVTTEQEAAKRQDRENQLLQSRRRWIVVLLWGLWIRIAEAASLKFSSFYKANDLWTVTVIGKGRKERALEVTSGVMQELSRYRESIGLPPLLLAIEATPAIQPVRPARDRPAGKTCTTSSIYREVKIVADLTARRLESCASALPEDEKQRLIERIKSISPHWFRHSAASEAINADFPMRDAADRLGHSSMDTTSSMYYHADARKKVWALEAIERAR